MEPSLVFYTRRFGLLGYLRHLFARFTGSHPLIPVTPEGTAHPLYLRSVSSDIPTYDKVFVQQEYRFTVASDPSVIVDAGANIGLAAIYFANRYPTARVIAIEPEPDNYALLARNTERYPNITPVRAALWSANTDIDLVDRGRGSWGFMTETPLDPAGPGVPATRSSVRAVTIDRLMDELEIDRISILKVDIEGAEREVFADSSAWLARVDAAIVELHDRLKPGCRSSVDRGTAGLEHRWEQGENAYFSRPGFLTPPPTPTRG